MRVMYRTSWSGNGLIEPVAVVRETAAFITILEKKWRGEGMEESRVAKSGRYDNYHDTWEAARDYLLGRANDEVIAARRRLESANGKLGNVKGLKAPTADNLEAVEALLKAGK